MVIQMVQGMAVYYCTNAISFLTVRNTEVIYSGMELLHIVHDTPREQFYFNNVIDFICKYYRFVGLAQRRIDLNGVS